MNTVSGDSISEVYVRLVNHVLEYGSHVTDERGQDTLECTNMVAEVYNPVSYSCGLSLPVYKCVKPPVNCFWTGERLMKYCWEFFDSDRRGFVYTYGNRLRRWFSGIDQIDESIGRLRDFENTRRAVSITWSPNADTGSDEVPCLMLVDFKIRNGKLLTTALWRSHDIFGAWFANVVGLTYLAQYVAEQVGNVTVGSVVVQSISAHVYMNDYYTALDLVNHNGDCLE